MLRARLLPDGRQAVLRDVPHYAVRRADLTDAAPDEAEAALARLRHEALSGFDPHRWPLFAVRVAQLPGGRARVLFTVDELIADGPSVSLLLQQWYAAYAHGTAPVRPASRSGSTPRPRPSPKCPPSPWPTGGSNWPASTWSARCRRPRTPEAPFRTPPRTGG